METGTEVGTAGVHVGAEGQEADEQALAEGRCRVQYGEPSAQGVRSGGAAFPALATHPEELRCATAVLEGGGDADDEHLAGNLKQLEPVGAVLV